MVVPFTKGYFLVPFTLVAQSCRAGSGGWLGSSFSKFRLMKRSPLNNEVSGTRWQTSVEYCQTVYTHQRFVPAI